MSNIRFAGKKANNLPRKFYLNDDVVDVAKKLLGKVIYTNFNNTITAGIITETEAYAGETDKASHAFGGRKTERTATMYLNGGFAYVYLCYGIHHLFNIVTNKKDIPHAVLLRGIFPVIGLETMMQRRNLNKISPKFSSGPGTASKALGIKTDHDKFDLCVGPITIADCGIVIPENKITIGPRIGVDYAGKDALLPYRFLVNNENIHLILKQLP
jgi:DNA-3-methyladenine glycosylase